MHPVECNKGFVEPVEKWLEYFLCRQVFDIGDF